MLLRPAVLIPLLLSIPAGLMKPDEHRQTDASNAVFAPQPAAAKSALSEPALSPDGKEIAFVSGGDIWTVPADGGVARLLVAHPATESRPVYSPDGSQLAFISMRTGNGDIYVLNLITGSLKRRTFDDGRDQLDGWSRDGQWLYFSSTAGDVAGMYDIWRVRSAGGQPVQVAADRYATEYWASPSPDNKTLAITARGTVSGQWWRHGRSHLDESELWLVHMDAPTPTYERLGEAGGAKEAWPQFAPDGQSVYYMSDRTGNENLWQKPLKGAAKQLTSFTDGRVLWPSIANNGSAVVFERDYGIWRYDVAKGKAQPVAITLRGAAADAVPERQTMTQGFQSLALAPDGRKLAFLARGEVFVSASREGGEAVRITDTPEPETDVTWLPDSRRVIYTSSRENNQRLFQYDVTTRTEKAITSADGRAVGARISPDGKWVAYRRNGRELRVVTPDGLNDHKLADGYFGEPPFTRAADVTWSPDSRWIAYLTRSARGFATVMVVPVDGGTPRPVSFSANSNASDLEWSPDGTFILYLSGQRTEVPQLIRIDLLPHTPRFREDQFRDLFAVPTAPPRDTTARPVRDTLRTDVMRSDTTRRPNAAPAATTATPAGSGTARAAIRPVNIVFEGIRERATILNTQLAVGSIAISPDGKNLLLGASAGGQQQLYLWSLDELAREAPSARPLTTAQGGKNSAQWSHDSREVWYTENGRVTVMPVDSRQARPVAVTAELLVDFTNEKQAIFQQAWSYLNMNFFDDKMNGADWIGLARSVEPYVAGSRNPDDLRRVLSLMVGELNASHLGVSGPASGSGPAIPVGKLGLRYEHAAVEGGGAAGWRVTEVIAQGPAAVAGIKVGDVVTSIDGVKLAGNISVDSLLMGKVGRRVPVMVTSAAASTGTAPGTSREAAVRPVNLGTEKGLLYRQWVEDRRAYVAKASNGRLGYVHMFDMGESSLDQLHLDLDAENQGREGVVVDVRNNNGGFVNAYAIDVLARRGYMQFTNRGSVTTPARITLGQRSLERPTVLVVNQHSLSDAEDFTEGYRSLNLGKVVGEKTAGWIIFTSNVNLLDGTTLRIPFSRVTDANGKEMELIPRNVDVPVIRPIGEAYSGKDSQLDAAVSTLLNQIGNGRR